MKNKFIFWLRISCFLFVNSSLACSPVPQKAYLYKFDDYVFVMLLENYRAVEYTKTVTNKEYEDFRQKHAKENYIAELFKLDISCNSYTVEANSTNDHMVLTAYCKKNEWTPSKLQYLLDESWKSYIPELIFSWIPKTLYKASGLYKKGNDTPEWTVDWYDANSEFFISDNGRYLVRMIDIYYPENIALVFYDSGKLVKEYKVNELIEKPESIMTDLSYCFGEKWAIEAKIENNNFTVKTKNEKVYSFDIVTGKMY